MSSTPAIILVAPQLPENIGACARAMLNFGCRDLRLVRPRDQWPHAKGLAAATGAREVAENARVFDTTAEAIADLHLVYATTARRRDVLKERVDLETALGQGQAAAGQNLAVGFLFGPERTGLDNEDLSLANFIVTFPTSEELSSLNLAQAVLLITYGWRQAMNPAEPAAEWTQWSPEGPATAAETLNFFEHLEGQLERAQFFRVPEKRDLMVQNLRNLFGRCHLQKHEVRTLHGVVAALSGRRKDGSQVRQARCDKDLA